MTRVQAADVRIIVAETLAEQQKIGRDDIDAMVVKAVATTLTSFGIDEDDRKELLDVDAANSEPVRRLARVPSAGARPFQDRRTVY
jgi:hypothetical protein